MWGRQGIARRGMHASFPRGQGGAYARTMGVDTIVHRICIGLFVFCMAWQLIGLAHDAIFGRDPEIQFAEPDPNPGYGRD